MSCKVVATHSFAIPKAHHRIHTSTDDFSWRCISASTNPLFVPVLLVEQLTNVLAAISVLKHDYRLYSRRPWSALPVTKLFFPTAREKTGWPWTGVQMMDSRGPLRHCDWRAICIMIKIMELLGVEPRASCMLSTRSTNWAITPWWHSLSFFLNMNYQKVQSYLFTWNINHSGLYPRYIFRSSAISLSKL